MTEKAAYPNGSESQPTPGQERRADPLTTRADACCNQHGPGRVLASKDWTDGEPDTLWIEVQRDESDGKAFITFTCSSTWLTPEVVESDVIPWLRECVIVARRP